MHFTVRTWYLVVIISQLALNLLQLLLLLPRHTLRTLRSFINLINLSKHKITSLLGCLFILIDIAITLP